jgi:hypothetical protein
MNNLSVKLQQDNSFNGILKDDQAVSQEIKRLNKIS